jgi:exodeoxyribonuclease VII large subunit
MEQPQQMFDTATQRLDDFERRVTEGLSKRIENIEHRFEKITSRLETVSPLRTLARGYSFTTDSSTGKIVDDIRDVTIGQRLRTRIVDGILHTEIIEIEPLG